MKIKVHWTWNQWLWGRDTARFGYGDDRVVRIAWYLGPLTVVRWFDGGGGTGPY